MAKAIGQLTQVVTLLAGNKTTGTQSRLDRALDGASGGAPVAGTEQPSGPITARRSQAALREMRKALTDSPEQILESLEHNMADDLPTSEIHGQVMMKDSRVWVEHRSRIQHFPATIRWVWAVAQIHNCLKADPPRVAEARARAALLLAAADQVAIDGGSWIVASELLLDPPPPPFTAFSSHRLPDPTEDQYSRLYDPRWVEVAQARLRELEEFGERKRKLLQRRAPEPARNDDERNRYVVAAKAEAKAKAKAAAGARRRSSRVRPAGVWHFTGHWDDRFACSCA
jgi:hypothetical protein